jgi:hypothetical protein
MKFSLQINVDLALMMSAPAGFARYLPAIGLFSPNEEDPDPFFFSLSVFKFDLPVRQGTGYLWRSGNSP